MKVCATVVPSPRGRVSVRCLLHTQDPEETSTQCLARIPYMWKHSRNAALLTCEPDLVASPLAPLVAPLTRQC